MKFKVTQIEEVPGPTGITYMVYAEPVRDENLVTGQLIVGTVSQPIYKAGDIITL